ncbi:MAG: alpha/beta hydrolase [Chlamydiota bacterium]
MNPYATGDNIALSEKKLIVCLHGLNSSPLQYKQILDSIHKRAPWEHNIYIPYVKDRGNAKLDDMVDPIFEKIEKWAQAGGEKELVLVGISNGGRIARAIEARLRNSDCKRTISSLRFVSIVGACKGSTLSNLAHRLGLSRLMSPNIAEEMPTDSKRFAQLNQELAKAPDYYDYRRDYIFIASPHDWMVPNYNSTLMEVPHFLARYAIIPGHGHNSIPYAKADVISEAILT